MIRAIPHIDRRRQRRQARRQWRARFVPVAILHVEGRGRSLVVMERMETRWSETHRRRLWRNAGGAA